MPDDDATPMLITSLLYPLSFILPLVLVWPAWGLSRRIQRTWLRSALRSLAMAAALTPTIVPVPGLHGALPMPAIWVFVFGIVGLGGENRWVELLHGGIPLLVVFAVIWLISLAIQFFRNRRGR
jgi:hypothetical protein